jgi:hypothetical protein
MDRFEKPITLMYRPNISRERRLYDHLSGTDCLECLAQFTVEILHPANGKIAVLQPSLYLSRTRFRTSKQVRAVTPLDRGPFIDDTAGKEQPCDLIPCTKH